LAPDSRLPARWSAASHSGRVGRGVAGGRRMDLVRLLRLGEDLSRRSDQAQLDGAGAPGRCRGRRRPSRQQPAAPSHSGDGSFCSSSSLRRACVDAGPADQAHEWHHASYRPIERTSVQQSDSKSVTRREPSR
jgi:hypothetical protein